MIEKSKIIKLTNRDTGPVGYIIPDTGAHRTFTAGETKEVTFDEIEKLSWTRGGKELLKNYLIIQDEEAVEEILGEVEPEYYYTQEIIKKLLKEGSLAQLQDALEFGPKGVVELIKQDAVDLKIDSNAKREEIFNKTGFNVSRSIELNENSEEDSKEEAATSKRRANPMEATNTKTTTSSTSGRYKIIN